MASPSPSPPPRARAKGWPACRKRSKSRGKNPASIPRPSSSTTSSARRRSSLVEILMWPPGSQNLTELLSRFITTCCKRTASPQTSLALSASSRLTRTSFSCAAGVVASTAASITLRRSSGDSSSLSLPLMMRDTSSRSSISRACRLALRRIVSMARPCSAGASVPAWTMCAQPVIAFNGLRSS